ncbi:hypothetical protein AB3466_11780 [Sphingobacterium thalpophilum]|uniref:hypothetical protein n=1 Tax=Sphingobacterium thalpophilum TaxID=259 RepID=UPI0031DC0D63
MTDSNINYNSAYISLNLLDELDYCLGGYGKPNMEFLFSLNTFVETFIASSSFYTSLDELNHLNLTAPALFPNGRPILHMLAKAGGLKFVNGVIEKAGREIYRKGAETLSKKDAQREFILEKGSDLNKRYFLKSEIDTKIHEIPLITSKVIGGEYIVSEVLTKSSELVSNLLEVSKISSIQTSLPIYLYEEQLSTLVAQPYSIKSLERLAKLHEENLESLLQDLNFRYLPIPPFTNILLGQVSSISQIPEKLIQLRLDFQELRNKFVELECDIHGTRSLKEQRDAHRKFQDFWATFIRRYSDRRNRIHYSILGLTPGVDIDKAADKMFDENNFMEAFKDLNLGKLGGNILSKSFSEIKERRIINRYKGLTNIWELFQKGKGIEEQIRHFERLFGVQISNAEINKVNQFINTKVAGLSNRIVK